MRPVFSEYKIKLTDNAEIVLNIFEQCKRDCGINDAALEFVASENAGGVKEIALKILEAATSHKYGRKAQQLNAADALTIDPMLYVLYKEYRVYLSKVFLETGRKARDVLKSGRHALVYWLLLRTMASALSTDHVNPEHNFRLLNLVERFSDSLVAKGVLYEIKGIEKKEVLSAYDIAFSLSEYREKIATFREAIEANKIMELPRTAIIRTISFLEKLKMALVAHLMVAADYKFEQADLIEGFFENTLNNFEKKFIAEYANRDRNKNEKKEIIALSEIEIGDININAIKLTQTQQCIIHHFKIIYTQTPEKANRIENIYTLLCNTNLLLEFSDKVSESLTGVNWAYILSGRLNLTELSRILKMHSQTCNSILDINKDEFQHNRDNSGYQALIRCRFLGSNFLGLSYSVFTTLDLLTKKQTSSKFKKKMRQTDADLVVLNGDLKRTFQTTGVLNPPSKFFLEILGDNEKNSLEKSKSSEDDSRYLKPPFYNMIDYFYIIFTQFRLKMNELIEQDVELLKLRHIFLLFQVVKSADKENVNIAVVLLKITRVLLEISLEHTKATKAMENNKANALKYIKELSEFLIRLCAIFPKEELRMEQFIILMKIKKEVFECDRGKQPRSTQRLDKIIDALMNLEEKNANEMYASFTIIHKEICIINEKGKGDTGRESELIQPKYVEEMDRISKINHSDLNIEGEQFVMMSASNDTHSHLSAKGHNEVKTTVNLSNNKNTIFNKNCYSAVGKLKVNKVDIEKLDILEDLKKELYSCKENTDEIKEIKIILPETCDLSKCNAETIDEKFNDIFAMMLSLREIETETEINYGRYYRRMSRCDDLVTSYAGCGAGK